MNLKYFVLFLLFTLNFAATVVADSSHIEFPSINTVDVNHSEHVSNDCSDSSGGHCPDDDCCHQNHIHYYLLPLDLLNLTANSKLYKFPEYAFSVSSLYSDIIKPPLV